MVVGGSSAERGDGQWGCEGALDKRALPPSDRQRRGRTVAAAVAAAMECNNYGCLSSALFPILLVEPYARNSTKGKLRYFSRPKGYLLEPSRTGTYVKYPYLGSHGSSTPIPVTQHRSHVFLVE